MLFIQSLESSIIPECLKRAAIVQIYKSGDKSVPSNYRPISLTPILMKIFERVIRKQVTKFLTERGYLNSSQHGFREERSCCCCCLPTPMTLASGGSPMFPLVVHQPASLSIWPAVQSLRRGLSTNPGATMWCVCGCS